MQPRAMREDRVEGRGTTAANTPLVRDAVSLQRGGGVVSFCDWPR